jgi:hypothetical protein
MPRKRKAPKVKAPERRFPRIPAETSVLLRRLGGPVKGELSVTRVLGLGGCCFLHKEPQGVGSTLFLSILVGQELAEARVRVVYEIPQGDGTVEVGTEFLEITQGDRALLEGLMKPGEDPG